MTITLTGATGFLGRHLQKRLRESGHELRILARKPEPDTPGVRYFPWDAGQSEPPAEALDGTEAVINLVGEPVATRWSDDVMRRIRSSRVEGTRRLVHALTTQTRRPATLVSASAIGFYGPRGDEVLTEQSEPGQDFLAEVCREWEQQADLAAALGLRVVKLRIGIVLGPNGGALKQMLAPFRLGAGGKLGSGRQWMSWIHIDDLIELLTLAATQPKWRGPVNGTAPNPVQNREFTKVLGEVLHRPTLMTVPALALKLLYGKASGALLASQRVLPEEAIRSGFQFRFPDLRAALEDILAKQML